MSTLLSMNIDSTFKEFWCGVRRTSAKRLQLNVVAKFVGEAKIRDFHVQVGVEQKILNLEEEEERGDSFFLK